MLQFRDPNRPWYHFSTGVLVMILLAVSFAVGCASKEDRLAKQYDDHNKEAVKAATDTMDSLDDMEKDLDEDDEK